MSEREVLLRVLYPCSPFGHVVRLCGHKGAHTCIGRPNHLAAPWRRRVLGTCLRPWAIISGSNSIRADEAAGSLRPIPCDGDSIGAHEAAGSPRPIPSDGDSIGADEAAVSRWEQTEKLYKPSDNNDSTGADEAAGSPRPKASVHGLTRAYCAKIALILMLNNLLTITSC